MVIVGNPELLVLDDHWADYLHFCLRNGAYTGCPLPDSILNTHATGQKGRALIGRLEMNSFVSQYVDNLDRRRWLGGNVDNEQEGFIVVPSGSESGLDEDDDEDNDEEIEGQRDDNSEDGFEQGLYDESIEGLSHALSHELDLNDEFSQGAAHRPGGQEQRNKRADEQEKEDRDDEDDETRVAKERLALGSLNMDDDTPELQSMHLNGMSSSHPSDRLSFGPLQGQLSLGTGSNALLRSQRFNEYGSEERHLQQQQQQRHQQPQQQHHQQQQRQTPVLSPISWPANDREFKRMSNSKLVLERSFDPTEQDIFEEY